jgi:prophage regulatory protein
MVIGDRGPRKLAALVVGPTVEIRFCCMFVGWRSSRLVLLRFPMVRERTGLSRSTIWRLERQGDFPKHRRISANVVAWVEAEVMSWIHSKVGDIAV